MKECSEEVTTTTEWEEKRSGRVSSGEKSEGIDVVGQIASQYEGGRHDGRETTAGTSSSVCQVRRMPRVWGAKMETTCGQ
jgi:hypothetical protein